MRDMPPPAAIALGPEILGRLMPMHLVLDHSGQVSSCGPTLAKTLAKTPGGRALAGQPFFALFEVRRPSGIGDLAALRRHQGSRLYLQARGHPATGLRGIAVPLAGTEGLLVNLSFGIGLVDAVRDHALTDADFAATELAVELLYVVEAKSAVMEELRALNLRLQGAKTMAEEQALTDILTGLRNRRAFEIALSRAVVSAADEPFGLMHLDLDFFKEVNDTFGHAAGDQVLRAVAHVLSEETRAQDTVARIGGDEFVIVLPGLKDAGRLQAIARRIIDRLARPIPHEGQPCRIAVSIGLALSSAVAPLTGSAILHAADLALYAAKRAGRGCCRLAGQDAAPAACDDGPARVSEDAEGEPADLPKL